MNDKEIVGTYSGSSVISKFGDKWKGFVRLDRIYKVKVISADKILYNSGRFDLLSKYLLIKAYIEQIDVKWYEEIYLALIYHYNNFQESDGNKLKIGKENFINSFISLYKEIKQNGFDLKNGLIPVTDKLVPIDGGHRIAICALLHINVSILILDQNTNFNYQYFAKKKLDSEISDFIAFSYCKFNPCAFVALIFPVAGKKYDNDIFELFNSKFDVFYKKEVTLFGNGPFLIVKNLYRQHPWVNSEDCNINIQRKTKACFQGLTPLRIIIFKANSLHEVLDTKDKIRDLYNIDNHSIHITDNQSETLECAKLLLNDNSIHWLNNAPKTVPKNFERIFQNLVNLNINFDYESFCIEGSSSLAIYGLRDVSDIDLWGKNKIMLNNLDHEIECSNENLDYLNNKTLNDLLYNPRNFFYYENVKVLSLEIIKELKKSRNTVKDKKDLILINPLLNNSKYFEKITSRVDHFITYYVGQTKYKVKKILPLFLLIIYRLIRDKLFK